MIQREKNPTYLNSFLDYSITILNKSPNSVKEYNYDLTNFFRFIMIRFNMTNAKNPENIDITKFTNEDLKKITLEDIHSYVSHLAIDKRSKPATRARKISTIRIFFKYATVKEHILDTNPAQNLETPKLERRMPKYLSLEQSQKLLKVADSNIVKESHEEGLEVKTADYQIKYIFDTSTSKELELDNLLKEKEKLISSIERRKKLLANENYVAKAPASVVELDRTNLAKEESRLKEILEKLN